MQVKGDPLRSVGPLALLQQRTPATEQPWVAVLIDTPSTALTLPTSLRPKVTTLMVVRTSPASSHDKGNKRIHIVTINARGPAAPISTSTVAAPSKLACEMTWRERETLSIAAVP